MTKRDRVMAALRGQTVDRVPLSFWMHDFAAENKIESFVAESLRLAATFDWDYLKPQSRAQCFAEAWGLRYAASGARAVQYTRTHATTRAYPSRPDAGWRPASRARGSCRSRGATTCSSRPSPHSGSSSSTPVRSWRASRKRP